jgi:hypothetical protein
MASPQQRVTISTVRIVGMVGPAHLCMRSRKEDPRPSEQLSIGSGLAGLVPDMCQQDSRGRKRRGEFLKCAAQFGLLFFAFLYYFCE